MMKADLKPCISQIEQHLSQSQINLDAADCTAYSYDNSKQSLFLPDAVVFPESEQQVQAVVQSCFEHEVPIIPRGSGTGTVGGALATQGGIIISFERMTEVIDFDPANRLLTVQAGVTNQAVQDLAKSAGYFWAPNPSSAAICTIGGNIAHNSAGPQAVKYGTTRENTLGLRVVTGKGDLLKTGYYTSKGCVGYDLTRLLIGSEGTLAITTQATLKLTPLAEAKMMLRFYYRSIQDAAHAVSAIMATPVTPCSLEFMDENSISTISSQTDIRFPDGTKALLMLELDGIAASLPAASALIQSAANNPGLLACQEAAGQAEIDAFWAMRKALSPCLRKIAPKKINEDIAVPVSKLPDMIEGVDTLSKQYRIKNANFGHAGNGNIHVNLLVDPDNPDEMKRAADCLDKIFDLVISLGGTLSGEHGVGMMKQPYIRKELNPIQIAYMESIKASFDPKGILNPNKIW